MAKTSSKQICKQLASGLDPITGNKLTSPRKKMFGKFCEAGLDYESTCSSFASSPLFNPISNRKITRDSAVYNFLMDMCNLTSQATTSTSVSFNNIDRPSSASTKAVKRAKSVKSVKSVKSEMPEMLEMPEMSVKSSKSSKSSKPSASTASAAPSAPAVDQCAMLERKLEAYIEAIDEFYALRAKNNRTTSTNPVDVKRMVREVELILSEAYDTWIATGLEPVREMVTQFEPSLLPSKYKSFRYGNDFYNNAQGFFNHSSKMTIGDLDDIFKQTRDGFEIFNIGLVNEFDVARTQRYMFLDAVKDVDAGVKFAYTDTPSSESMDTLFVKLEFLLNVTSNARLAKYAKLVYDSLYEATIKRKTLSPEDANKIMSRCKQIFFNIKF
jgi:hypothetical protein